MPGDDGRTGKVIHGVKHTTHPQTPCTILLSLVQTVLKFFKILLLFILPTFSKALILPLYSSCRKKNNNIVCIFKLNSLLCLVPPISISE